MLEIDKREREKYFDAVRIREIINGHLIWLKKDSILTFRIHLPVTRNCRTNPVVFKEREREKGRRRSEGGEGAAVN